MPSTKIYLDQSRIANAGRGVFAAHKIKKGETIEQCPIILIKEKEVHSLRETELRNYYFMWGDDPKHHKAAIALGFGSLYNHSYSPNATYRKHIEEQYLEFIALRNISADEEITVNYNYGNPEDKSTLWIASIPPADQSE